ncbi:hypothetical protein TRVL_04137 [Trypanosoma vivax]|nr:hypothetical protein TRVL_04137 [Trypanosoma vivax]
MCGFLCWGCWSSASHRRVLEGEKKVFNECGSLGRSQGEAADGLGGIGPFLAFGIVKLGAFSSFRVFELCKGIWAFWPYLVSLVLRYETLPPSDLGVADWYGQAGAPPAFWFRISPAKLLKM